MGILDFTPIPTGVFSLNPAFRFFPNPRWHLFKKHCHKTRLQCRLERYLINPSHILRHFYYLHKVLLSSTCKSTPTSKIIYKPHFENLTRRFEKDSRLTRKKRARGYLHSDHKNQTLSTYI